MSDTQHSFSRKSGIEKRLIGDVKPFHSSAFAEQASGERMGSTAPLSFEKRRAVDQNRGMVRGYHESALGQTYSVLHSETFSRNMRPVAPRRGAAPVAPRPRPTPGFREPPARGYNPYS